MGRGCCLPLDAAAWNILTALPVAVFPSQCPGSPPAAWTPACLPTALHRTQEGKPWRAQRLCLSAQGAGVPPVTALSLPLSGGESPPSSRGSSMYIYNVYQFSCSSSALELTNEAGGPESVSDLRASLLWLAVTLRMRPPPGRGRGGDYHLPTCGGAPGWTFYPPTPQGHLQGQRAEMIRESSS